MKRPLVALGLLSLLCGGAHAQKIVVAGSLRVRQEAWDWFRPDGGFQNAYTFTGATLRYGATRTTKTGDTQIELALPLLLGLPTRASAPPPQGALGLGALYRGVNGSRNGALFVKQAFHRDRRLGLRVGRFEFNDGAETTPADPALAWIKSQRVAQRVVGTFSWTHVGRSFDGLHLSRTTPWGNVATVLAHPTRGVLDLDGQDTLTSVRVAYAAATRPGRRDDSRVFAVLYEDAREGVVKVDNRPAAVLAADHDPIRLVTVGGHHIATGQSPGGVWDLLVWGAWQGGDWGTQRHDAHALAVEAGWQPNGARHGLWLRAGANVYSGDRDPADSVHGTFYPLLNTPRLYARTPFFAEANARDLFVQAIVRPDRRTAVRADLHRVSLERPADRWYAAGGPFAPTGTFGLTGRANPSGARDVADLIDVGADRTLDSRTTASVYVGQMRGGSVARGVYPDRTALFAYVEVTVRF